MKISAYVIITYDHDEISYRVIFILSSTSLCWYTIWWNFFI